MIKKRSTGALIDAKGMSEYMKKRIVAITLLLALLTGGCAGPEAVTEAKTLEQPKEEASPSASKDMQPFAGLEEIIPKETVTLEVYSQLSNFSGEQPGWFAQLMKDKFNVKLNFIYNGSSDFYDRRSEQGSLGDIILFGSDDELYHLAIERGLLLDWEQDGLLGRYGTDIQQNMAKALEKNRKLSGGHIYGFGYDVAAESGEISDFVYHPDIRWDLYEQIGKPEVETLESYVDILKQMKEICPLSDSGRETYGVSLFSDWDKDMVMFVKSTCTNFFGVDEFGLGFYDVETGNFQGCLEENGYYIRALRFYNMLYRNDLLNPESRTQGYEKCTEDYRDGAAFFCIFSWLAASQYNTVAHTADGKMMLPLAAKDQKTLVYGQNPNGGNRLWTIGSATQYPELTMAILNWLCTPEGRMVSEYGPQGVCWDYDLEGNSCILDFGYRAQKGEKLQMPLGSGYEGDYRSGCPQFNNTTWNINAANPDSNGQTYNYQYWPNVLAIKVSDIEERWRKETGASSAQEYLSGLLYAVSKPNTYTAGAKSQELRDKWEKVSECVKDGSWKAIFAETEGKFEEMVAQMRQSAVQAGYEDCAAWCQDEAAMRKASEE